MTATVGSERRAEDASVEPLLGEHLDYLRLRNQRPRSIRERQLTVRRTANLLGHPVADATAAELQAWQQEYLTPLTPAGMHGAIVHVAQFLKWCAKQGHRADDPSHVLVRPQHLNQRLPRPLGDADIAHAMSCADQPERAWLALGAFCGLRCMEIASLQREDVVDGVDVPFLRIIGKRGKERIVPLPVSVLAELRAAGMPARGHLFARLDGHGGPPSAMRVSERGGAHMKACGVNGTMHQLRHRFGTKLYEATHDPFLVATVMGHDSTQTTMGYVRISPHAAALPVEQISNLAERLA